MNDFLSESIFFGVFLTLFAYQTGVWLAGKWKVPICNPLLIAAVMIIAVLKLGHIGYDTYMAGSKYVSFFLTPVTVCLALPLYRQIRVLKKNAAAVIISIGCGCVAHALTITGLCSLLGIKEVLWLSLLPKSVTTPIAVGLSGEIGGMEAVTAVGVSLAGIFGAIAGPAIMKIFRIKEPVAQGLGIGTASHALGTTKALELGEIQGAMSALAIVVAGILTVCIVPWIAAVL